MRMAASADKFFDDVDQWSAELRTLRKILKATPLAEEIKWGGPCYTFNGANVVGLGAFKAYFGLWFFQGVLLSDPLKILINAQEGRTKAQRQWRMKSATDINARAIKKYVLEAIELARTGTAVTKSPPKPLVLAAPLKKALAANKRASEAFKALTPGRRREYADYVNEAKQEATRARRIKKILPMIVAGGGLNDKYR
jgi:uncharacterized protein YdeI (YjbR/CyaY-like superfamily)